MSNPICFITRMRRVVFRQGSKISRRVTQKYTTEKFFIAVAISLCGLQEGEGGRNSTSIFREGVEERFASAVLRLEM